jgi:hypothetical protein
MDKDLNDDFHDQPAVMESNEAERCGNLKRNVKV